MEINILLIYLFEFTQLTTLNSIRASKFQLYFSRFVITESYG